MKTYKEIAEEIINNEEKFNPELETMALSKNFDELFGERTKEDSQNLGDYLNLSIGKIYTWIGNANSQMNNKELQKIFNRISRLSLFIDSYFKVRIEHK